MNTKWLFFFGFYFTCQCRIDVCNTFCMLEVIYITRIFCGLFKRVDKYSAFPFFRHFFPLFLVFFLWLFCGVEETFTFATEICVRFSVFLLFLFYSGMWVLLLFAIRHVEICWTYLNTDEANSKQKYVSDKKKVARQRQRYKQQVNGIRM